MLHRLRMRSDGHRVITLERHLRSYASPQTTAARSLPIYPHAAGSTRRSPDLARPQWGTASIGSSPIHAETGFGSADLREPRAARTKLFPSSHIGPGNLRHSVRTSS